MQIAKRIKSITLSKTTCPNNLETGILETLFNAVHLAISPLLGIKELNKYPNAIALIKSNALGLNPRGLINKYHLSPLNTNAK